eukprot:scaffold3400_cov169-Amphora_coffeaeformis.AAC.6
MDECPVFCQYDHVDGRIWRSRRGKDRRQSHGMAVVPVRRGLHDDLSPGGHYVPTGRGRHVLSETHPTGTRPGCDGTGLSNPDALGHGTSTARRSLVCANSTPPIPIVE